MPGPSDAAGGPPRAAQVAPAQEAAPSAQEVQAAQEVLRRAKVTKGARGGRPFDSYVEGQAPAVPYVSKAQRRAAAAKSAGTPEKPAGGA